MSFLGLDIAISALRANQYALNVTGHNIANADTEGYHRQEAVFTPGLVTTGGTTTGQGIPKLGTGVNIGTVRRLQSNLVDGQLRHMNQFLGSWSARSNSLKQVETILAEPGASGLANSLDQFWNSWEELTTSPESMSARIAVIESGNALSERFRSLHSDLYAVQVQANDGIGTDAFQINTIAQEIAKLNNQISMAPAGEAGPNDLLDQRDILVDRLSKLVDLQTFGSAGADFIVSIGGQVLVQGNHTNQVEVDENASGWYDLVWSETGSKVDVGGGEVSGLIQVRDSMVAGYITSLNTIAEALVQRVNQLHTSGIDLNGNPGGSFFTAGSNAASLSIDPALVGSPARIAASTSGDPGDNTLALSIAGVRDEVLVDGQSINDAYGRLVVRIGAQAREATTQADVHETSLQYLQTQRESLSGVSIDEEMINMVKFQQAYNAAARVVTVIDEMIDTVVNRMGVAGR